MGSTVRVALVVLGAAGGGYLLGFSTPRPPVPVRASPAGAQGVLSQLPAPPPPPVRSEAPALPQAAPPPVRRLFRPLVAARPPDADADRPPARLQQPPPVPVEKDELSTPEEPDEPGLALVGVFELGDVREAVLEDTERGITANLAVGEEAFGVTLERIEGDRVLIRRDDETELLILGEDKPAPKVQIIGDPTGLLRDPLNAPLRALPPAAVEALARALPRGGIVRNVRASGSRGRRYWRIQKSYDGLNSEARIAEDGTVLRVYRQVRSEDVPAKVLETAARAVPGYEVNESKPPMLWDRDGRRFYEIEVRSTTGRERVELRITPEGNLIGRD